MKLAIIHGTQGNPGENWFPWLREEAERHGLEAIVPLFPTPGNQTPEAWREVFAQEVGEVGPDLILVGHSLGAVFTLRLLEQASAPAYAAYLLSGFTGFLGLPEFDELNAPFVDHPYDWDTIKRSCDRFTVWMGADDPYVPTDQGQALAAALDVPLKLIEKGGHLNAAAGFTSFNDLWDEIAIGLGGTS